MKTNQNHPPGTVRNVVAAARAMIEQQLSPRSEQQSHLLHLALNKAEAASWETGVPHLVFPTLALETIRKTNEWRTRQDDIFCAGPGLAA